MQKNRKINWNLSSLLTGNTNKKIAAEQQIIAHRIAAFVKKWKQKTTQFANPRVLRKALDEYEHIRATHGAGGNAEYYFWLRSNQDQTDPIIKAHKNQCEEFSTKQENELLFFTHAIAHLPKAEQKKLLRHSLLKPYTHFLERLFVEAKYLLSQSEEKIIGLLSGPSYGDWTHLTSELLAKSERLVYNTQNKKEKLPFSRILALTSHQNKRVRDTAAQAVNDILSQYADIAETEINAILKRKKVLDDARGFSRSDQSRYISDDVDPKTIDTLLSAVSSHNRLSRDFYKLKARLFKKTQLEYHERNLLPKTTDVPYSYEKSLRLVRQVLGNLDPQFGIIIDTFIAGKHIDAYPARGKRDGAFCVHGTKTQPVYVLLNHTDKLHDALTMAHEFGHGINNELMRVRQNGLYYETPLSTAEVASTFMEDFVFEELLAHVSPQEKLGLLITKLDNDIMTIFRQIACVRFEQELHIAYKNSGYLPKEKIGKLFAKHMSAYMGPAIKQSSGSQNWWIHWGHIRNFFYNYSYAHGLLISKALQSRVRKNPAYIAQVKQFLSAGLSQSPQNIFASIGINIHDSAFWKSGVQEVERLLTQTKKLARDLKKIN